MSFSHKQKHKDETGAALNEPGTNDHPDKANLIDDIYAAEAGNRQEDAQPNDFVPTSAETEPYNLNVQRNYHPKRS